MNVSTRWTSLAFALALTSLLASCISGGSIERGRKFGVAVGMPYGEASGILERRGLHRRELQWPVRMCGGRARGSDERIDLFVRGINHRPICLFSASDRVVAIAWEAY